MPTALKGSADGSHVDAWRHVLEAAPSPFAITQGRSHVVSYTNKSFRGIAGEDFAALGHPIVGNRHSSQLRGLLDRAFDRAAVVLDEPIDDPLEAGGAWSCTAWPLGSTEDRPDGFVIELRRTDTEPTSHLHRRLAERLLMGALREQEAGDAALVSRTRALFLADAGKRIAESMTVDLVRGAISELRLPGAAEWCIVDIIDGEGAMQRLAIAHPDAGMQGWASRLDRHWSPPRPGDHFGLGAVMETGELIMVTENVQEAIAPVLDDLDLLERRAVRSLLTVPMAHRGRVLGAITFVSTEREGPYAPDEINLARELADRSATALENARVLARAVEARVEAQEASAAKLHLLASVSHELRTPLHVMMGYLNLLEMGAHGPITAAQRADLARIREGENQLLLITKDLLDYLKFQSGHVVLRSIDVPVREALVGALTLFEPLITEKELQSRMGSCASSLTVRGDPDRIRQILSNLIANAIKFTRAGGAIGVECDVAEGVVHLRVWDTGIGIPPSSLEAIFDPFVQAGGATTGTQRGVGLGLAISRDLARAMQGDLTVEVLDPGSRFTLTLPRGFDRSEEHVS
jgi:signal transduction histidine kinase